MEESYLFIDYVIHLKESIYYIWVYTHSFLDQFLISPSMIYFRFVIRDVNNDWLAQIPCVCIYIRI